MNDKFESETFQMPSELQDVPTNYTMSHITYEDVNGILSLVEIALARGSIKGDELQILNQIRNDCLLEVQDYQAWVQKRQQVLAVEQQLMAEEAKARQAKEIEIAKEQLRIEGKPESMLDNIAKGKLKRFFKDNTLVNQIYIKDSKQNVSQYISSIDDELKILGFSRLALV